MKNETTKTNITAMTNEGLCINCCYNQKCMNAGNSEKPVLFCEEHK